MKYKILESYSRQDLANQVEGFLRAGWYISGGVCVVRDISCLRYYQAITKTE